MHNICFYYRPPRPVGGAYAGDCCECSRQPLAWATTANTCQTSRFPTPPPPSTPTTTTAASSATTQPPAAHSSPPAAAPTHSAQILPNSQQNRKSRNYPDCHFFHCSAAVLLYNQRNHHQQPECCQWCTRQKERGEQKHGWDTQDQLAEEVVCHPPGDDHRPRIQREKDLEGGGPVHGAAPVHRHVCGAGVQERTQNTQKDCHWQEKKTNYTAGIRALRDVPSEWIVLKVVFKKKKKIHSFFQNFVFFCFVISFHTHQ